MATRRSNPGRQSTTTLRESLADYFEERITHYEAHDGVRRPNGFGGHSVYPGVGLLERLRNGDSVTVQSFYVTAACQRAGISPPDGITAGFGAVVVGTDGTVTAH